MNMTIRYYDLKLMFDRKNCNLQPSKLTEFIYRLFYITPTKIHAVDTNDRIEYSVVYDSKMSFMTSRRLRTVIRRLNRKLRHISYGNMIIMTDVSITHQIKFDPKINKWSITTTCK